MCPLNVPPFLIEERDQRWAGGKLPHFSGLSHSGSLSRWWALDQTLTECISKKHFVKSRFRDCISWRHEVGRASFRSGADDRPDASLLFRMTLDTLKHRDITKINRMLKGLVRLVAGVAFAVGQAAEIDWVLNG